MNTACRLRSLLTVLIALATVACDERSPVAPVPPATSVPITPALPATRQVTGVVRDTRGTPIAGATVIAVPGNITVFSDQAGRFDITIGAGGSGLTVSATSAGFEPDWRYAVSPTLDFMLHEIVRIPVGQSVRVTVRPDDVLDLWEEYRIRVVRITADRNMRVGLRVVPDGNFSATYFVRGAGCCNQGAVDIAGGTELEVEIRIPSDTLIAQTFTVITSDVSSTAS